MPAHTFIDDVEVSGIVLSGSVTRTLNGMATATVSIPIDRAIDGIGVPLRVEIDEVPDDLHFHGFIKHESSESGEDAAEACEYSAEDPREILQWRPARNGPDTETFGGDPVITAGDYSSPSFFQVLKQGPVILRDVLSQSQVPSDFTGDSEGDDDLPFDLGSFATGGPDLSGAPTNYPMTIEDLIQLLTSTGVVDVVFTPTNPGAGIMARVDVYNGDYGTDRSADVHFAYEEGGNVRQVRQTKDMDKTVNKLRYLLGQAKDDRHWYADVNGQNPGNFPPSSPPPAHPPDLNTAYAHAIEAIDASRVDYFTRAEIRILDSLGDENTHLLLYRWQWVMESFLRAQPRVLSHITPVRGIAPGYNIPWFDIGDLIHVSAWANFRGGFDGNSRVYGYTLNWDTEGVYELGEILTSSDGEAVKS